MVDIVDPPTEQSSIELERILWLTVAVDLSETMLDEMLTFTTDLPADHGWLGSGMGVSVFRLSMVNGAYAYGSGGWGAVVLSATAYLPDHGATITALTNALNWSFGEGVMRSLCTVVMEYDRQ